MRLTGHPRNSRARGERNNVQLLPNLYEADSQLARAWGVEPGCNRKICGCTTPHLARAWGVEPPHSNLTEAVFAEVSSTKDGTGIKVAESAVLIAFPFPAPTAPGAPPCFDPLALKTPALNSPQGFSSCPCRLPCRAHRPPSSGPPPALPGRVWRPVSLLDNLNLDRLWPALGRAYLELHSLAGLQYPVPFHLNVAVIDKQPGAVIVPFDEAKGSRPGSYRSSFFRCFHFDSPAAYLLPKTRAAISSANKDRFAAARSR